jgi:hypothetical protein
MATTKASLVQLENLAPPFSTRPGSPLPDQRVTSKDISIELQAVREGNLGNPISHGTSSQLRVVFRGWKSMFYLHRISLEGTGGERISMAAIKALYKKELPLINMLSDGSISMFKSKLEVASTAAVC